MKKKKQIAIAAGLLLLIGTAGYTVILEPLSEREQWIYKESTVERGTLTAGVSESGVLEYGISAALYDLDLDVEDGEENDNEGDDDEKEDDSGSEYLQIDRIYVASGERIAQGDALVKFTEDSVADVRRMLESALVEAKADYQEAESAYELSALEAKTSYDTKKAEEKYASSIHQNASAAASNDVEAIRVEISQRNANIPLLEEKLQEASEDYAEALEIYEEALDGMEQTDTSHTENFMTIQRVYLNADTRYQNAKTALETARQNLEDNAAQIASLEKKLAAAEAKEAVSRLETEEEYLETVIEGENAEVWYQAELAELKETLSEAEEKKKRREEQLAAFEEFVGEEGILYADGSGIVTQLNYKEGDTLVQSGAVVSYAAAEDMTISVDVTQEDVVDLSVGDKVDIAFTAYEAAPFEGTVLSIDTTAVSEESKTVSYRVVVGVEGDTERLYGGMTADVTFVTEKKEDVLFVSRNAIVEENGRTYVYRETPSGGRELTEVETGMSNGVYVEITSGLSEGDIIYIASRVSSEEEVEATLQEDGQEGEEFSDGKEFPEGAMQMMQGADRTEMKEMPEMPGREAGQ